MLTPKIKTQPIFSYQDAETGKIQAIWKFSNGWGVSISRGKGLRGGEQEDCWSFAVIYWPTRVFADFELDYDNPLCKGDVLLNIPSENIDSLLQVVQNYPVRGSTWNFKETSSN